MKGSDIFVKALENEGVEYIFGIPGEENLDFLNSLKDSSIKLILTRHEQAAGFMAATYGRLTGKVGVCLSTLGPGATNFMTAAAYAQLGAMPMMMITGQKPIKKSKQGQFQIVDIVDMMRPLTKFTKQIVDANNIPSLVRESVRIAEEERPGAVHLELPEDIASEEGLEHFFTSAFSMRPEANQESVDVAVKYILKAKKPLLLIGAAANRNRVALSLKKFIHETGIFFFNTQMGKGVVDERSHKYLGTAALSDNDYLHCAVSQADLIINVGHDVIEKPPFFMHPGGVEVIHVNNFGATVDDVYFPQVEVIGDIAKSIDAIHKTLGIRDIACPEGFARIKKGLDDHIYSKADDNGFPIIPQKVVADVREVMPDDGIITLDNGVYKIWFARNYQAYYPNTILLDNALATMGAGLASAIGAKIVKPDKKVLTICGDGGFMMNSQEIETAVRLGLDLVVVILRDNAYGMIKWKQAGMGFDNFGLDYGNPDFVKYAESYGACGKRVGSNRELFTVLDECLNSKGVHIVEVPVDYSENEKVLIDELQNLTCELI